MLFLILHSSILSKSGASTKPGAIHTGHRDLYPPNIPGRKKRKPEDCATSWVEVEGRTKEESLSWQEGVGDAGDGHLDDVGLFLGEAEAEEPGHADVARRPGGEVDVGLLEDPSPQGVLGFP